MTKKAKIGSPLFILREDCQKDLMGVIEKLAEIGFDGIEFLGMFGHKPADIKKKLDSCNMTAIGDHVSFDEFVQHTDKVIDERKAMGCKYITIGAPPSSGLPGGSDYPRTIEAIEKIGAAMHQADMTLLYHNHAEELRDIVNGKAVLEHLLDDISSAALSLEPDLGWMQIGGGNPAYYLEKYRDRCPVVHFKDYAPAGKGFVFRPTGYGVMDNAGLYAKTLQFDPLSEWVVMDHDDAYGRDSYGDLAMSLEFFRNLMLVTG
ncbi:MAG: sugar phosphate isomerase/epimerase [Defluviitaleaceae bacterium]|nr:sugar phosphate isomerase/epimerase [Defluviitaleaceae bacterium]